MLNILLANAYAGDNFYEIVNHCVEQVNKYNVICAFNFNGVDVFVDSSINSPESKAVLWTCVDYCMEFDIHHKDYESFKTLYTEIEKDRLSIERKIRIHYETSMAELRKKLKGENNA